MSYTMGQIAGGLLVAWVSGFSMGWLFSYLIGIVNAMTSNESE